MDGSAIRINKQLCDDPLGTLHEGRDSQDRLVLVYLPQIQSGTAPELIVTRLESVARTLAEPPIAGLVTISRCGIQNATTPYIVMPQLQGITLEQALTARQRQPEGPARILPGALQIGQALAMTLLAAHGRGQFHLALSPSQIVLPTDAQLKHQSLTLLRGVGIARVTGQHRAHRWKPIQKSYAAPEQLSAQRATIVGAPSDVYSLGVLLFHMLSGRSPTPPAQLEPANNIDSEQNPSTLVYHDVTLPGELSLLLMRMLSVLPDERPTMKEVIAGLTEAVRDGADAQTAPYVRLNPDSEEIPSLASAATRGRALTVPSRIPPAPPTPATTPTAPASASSQQAPLPVPAVAKDTRTAAEPPPVNGADPVDPNLGTLFGNFKAIRVIGQGGMGTVYEAQHQTIGRRAAVKVMHRHIAQNKQYAKRFLNEARSVNIVRHPGIVEIFEYGERPDGTLYIVMEFLDGESLATRMLQQGGAYPPGESVRVAHMVAVAMAAAHDNGVIHRDLKPDNIMLTPNPTSPGQDWVKILDFGIAKMGPPKEQPASDDQSQVRTKVGAFLGTPSYMAPEQYGRAEGVTGSADVFSLGVILYQLLTGQPLFQGSAMNLLERAPPSVRTLNKAVPLRLSALVERMVSVRRDDRPTMGEVAKQLEALLPNSTRVTRRFVVAAGAAGLLIGALLITLFNAGLAPTPAELRNRSREVLAGYLQDKDRQTRISAVQAIGETGDFALRTLLEPLVKNNEKLDPGASEFTVVAQALGKLGAVDSTARFLTLMSQSGDPLVQLAAADALAQLQDPRGSQELRRQFSHGAPAIKFLAALNLISHKDIIGSPFLWKRVESGLLGEKDRVAVLSQLGQAGDLQARQRLSDDFPRLTSGVVRVQAAYNLAKLSEDSGWDYLKQAAKTAERPEEQLPALQLLAGLGDPEPRPKLLELANDRKQPDSVRENALQGIGDAAQQESLLPLSKVLAERGASARLQIAAAGAILKITAGERARLGEQSLAYALAARGSDSLEVRRLAVAMLATMDSDQAILPLGAALADREREIRLSAARALGKKNARAAVQALKPALEDKDPEVRSIAMQSIGQVLKALEQRGDRGAAELVIASFQHMAAGQNELDRIAASAVLLQVGAAQASERSILRSGLASKDAQARRLAVELGEPDRSALVSALADHDATVSLAAARKLANQGFLEGKELLLQTAARGDKDGLLCFVALRNLRVSVPTPPGLAGLLTSADVPVRLQVLDLLPQLPAGEARQLLQIGLLNAVPLVRQRAAEVAAGLYRQGQQLAFLRMVRSLRDDPNFIVRVRAGILAEDLERLPKLEQPHEPSPAADSVQRTEPAHREPSDSTPSVAAKGAILVVGDDQVRFRLGKNPPQAIDHQPIPVPPGKYHISYLGGAKNVEVGPNKTAKVLIPVSQAEQLLNDAKEALKGNDLKLAQELLDRLGREVQRGTASASLQADFFYQKARLHEQRGNVAAAVVAYNHVLEVPETQRGHQVNDALNSMFARLSGKYARIHIVTLVDGKCKLTRDFLSPPGQQSVGLGNGQNKVVYAPAGHITPVGPCRL